MGRSNLTVTGRIVGLSLAVVLAVAGCGIPETDPPSPTPVAPSTSASPATSPTPEPIPTLVVGIGDDLAGGLSNAATGTDAIRLASFVHGALYRLDGRLRPVPELAAGPAEVSSDGLTWTVPLRTDLTFHDGTPVTVDDVVATYRLATSRRCPLVRSSCLTGAVTGLEAVGDDASGSPWPNRSPGSTPSTSACGSNPSTRLDAAFEIWADGAAQVSVDELVAFLQAVAAAPSADEPDLRAEGERILTAADAALPNAETYTTDGELDDGCLHGRPAGPRPGARRHVHRRRGRRHRRCVPVPGPRPSAGRCRAVHAR